MSATTANLRKGTTLWLKILGWYQLVGGVIGLAFVFWMAFSAKYYSIGIIGILVITFVLFFFSMYAGQILLINSQKGITLSLINQCLQVIGFAYAGYAFRYNSGIYLGLGFEMTDGLHVRFGLGISTGSFSIATADPDKSLIINLVPIVLIWLLEKLKSAIRQADEYALLEKQ